MHKRFDHAALEKKWQEAWKEQGIYNTDKRIGTKEKEYILVEWPYPSGNLHIGHWYAFGVPDIYVRHNRMLGKQVIFPMGFDAFGLPAENAAIKRDINPREWTESNIEYMKTQLESMGNAFSWDLTTSSTDQDYYRWTQWMFTKFFEEGIAYRGEAMVNWDPVDNTVIANEQVLPDGTSERSGALVEQKRMAQWMMRITDYADALVDDLEELDWPEHIKDAQRAWIGRSQGAEIDFELNIPKEKPKALILHGFAGDPEVGWKPWLKKTLEARGYEVQNPKLPNFESPDYDEVMDFIRAQTEDFTEHDMVIGHSLGCHFAMKLAEEKSLGKVVCVAPSFSLCNLPFDQWRKNLAEYDIESAIKILENYPINEANVQVKQKMILFGEHDAGIPLENTTRFTSGWQTTIIPDVGHMSEEKEVPEIMRAATDTVTVFTTRPDTLYGATYMVLAPEHDLVRGWTSNVQNQAEVEAYVAQAAQKKEMDRLDNTKEKTGVLLEGITATNPASGEEIPVYIADYVLASYGTGAIMAVPGHDQRDHAFAEKFGIEIRQVIAPDIHLTGEMEYQQEKETLTRRCVDAIIEHPTDGTFLLQTDSHTHFVGGGTDGEDLLIALDRELKEETGFVNYDVISQVMDHCHCTGYRIPKDKNQITDSAFYHIKLKDLEQIPSEIEDGKHTVQWVSKEQVLDHFEWPHHRSAWLTFTGQPFTETGKLCNSGEFDGINSEEAKMAITEKVGGRMTNTYRLRDWSIGRQRYWGVPIPIVYDPDGKAHVVPEEHLPWTLPEDVDFKPTGEPPLAKSEELKKRTEDIFGPGWTPEVETMDTFVDSSWYFLRYLDNQNDDSLSSLQAQEDWMQIDIYFGGAEHTTMHLLYSRFWQKALHSLGLVNDSEPYKRRINRGLILGPDGNKMSKSKGNVIDPDEQVKNVGADTVKMYLAFMGPYQGSNYPWDLGGLAGIHRFLERVNGLQSHITEEAQESVTKLLHKTIKKVGEDIDLFKFNTAISSLMIFLNEAEKNGLTLEDYDTFLRVLAPFAPHLVEELWHDSGNTTSVHCASFPVYDSELATDTEVTIGVQINGKVRGDITISPEASEAEAVATAETDPDLAERLGENSYQKVIYKAGKILNFIITP